MTALLPFVPENEHLLWSGYQRSTSRTWIELIGRTLLWLVALAGWGGWIGLTGYILFCGRFDLRLVELILLLIPLTGILFGIGTPLWKSLYRRLRYSQPSIYGFTQKSALLLHPWKTDKVAIYALSELPHLKIFARTDGTFNAYYLVNKEFYADGQQQYHLQTEHLFLDAIGDRGTAQLLQHTQRAAKASSSTVA